MELGLYLDIRVSMGIGPQVMNIRANLGMQVPLASRSNKWQLDNVYPITMWNMYKLG